MSLKFLPLGAKFLVNSSFKNVLKPHNCAHLIRFNSNIKVVTYENVKELIQEKGTYIIDVRPSSMFQNDGHIPTSLSIPLKNVRKQLGPEFPKECFRNIHLRSKPGTRQSIVFTCKTGKHALMGAEIAVSLGYKNVLHYKGSYDDWVANESGRKDKPKTENCRKAWEEF